MFKANVQMSAGVRYRLEILGPDGRLISALPWKKNLILDQGLNAVAARAWIQNFTYAAVGTGITATRRDSGAVTISRAGTTLTASAGYFEAADAGRLFKFDTGEEVRIVTYTDATHVETVDSGAIAAAEGTVWYVNQTALAVETKRSTGYTTNSGDNGSTFTAGKWTFKRSFIFSAEGGTINYREIGWSDTNAAGANLFGRDLFAGVGVTLVAGQQLKAIAELTVELSPVVSTAFVNPITGWGDAGFCGIERAALFRIDANGNQSTPSGSASLEPFSASKAWTLSNSTAAIAAATDANPALVAVKIISNGAAYVAGSFTRKFIGKAAIGELNAATHRSIHFGEPDGGSAQTYSAFRVLMDTAQTKLSTHTLQLEFTFTWGRILTN